MAKVYESWTEDKVKTEALKYKNKSDFHKSSHGAYDFAKKKGIFNEVCSHMKVNKRHWSYDKVFEAAGTCKTRTEFHLKYRGAYDYAKRNKFLDEVNGSFKKIQEKWTHKSVAKIAKKYQTRFEFKEDYNGAHTYARKNGILDEVCSHMPILGNHYKRCVYAIFDDKQIYVGLTCNFERRYHSRKDLAALRKTGRYVKLTDYMGVKLAMGVEKELIRHYREDTDLECLNIQDGGGLGACKVKPKYL